MPAAIKELDVEFQEHAGLTLYECPQSRARDPLAYVDRYVFDLVGNRLTKTHDTDGDGTLDATTSYQYDANDRVLAETQDWLGTVNDRYTQYEYGPQNAGTAQTRQTVYEGLSADPLHMLSQTDYAYNLQGRLAEVAVDTDADGTPEHVTHLAYAADGTCVGETVDGQATAFLVDHQNFTGASQVLEEKDAAGGVLRSYTLGWDVIAQQAPTVASGATLYLLKDGLGSTRALCGATGQPVSGQVYAFDAYGNPLGFDPAAALAGRLYNGERYMAGAGLYDLRSRVYSTSLGRFPTSDGYAGALYSPSSLHRYAFCHGDSINFADPSGQSESYEAAMNVWLAGVVRNTLWGAFFGAYNAIWDPLLGDQRVTIGGILQGAALGAYVGFAFGVFPPPLRVLLGGGLSVYALKGASDSLQQGQCAQAAYRGIMGVVGLGVSGAQASSVLNRALNPPPVPSLNLAPYDTLNMASGGESPNGSNVLHVNIESADLPTNVNGGRLIADATSLDMIPAGQFGQVQANHIPGDLGVAQGIISEGYRVLAPGGVGMFSSSSLGNVPQMMEEAGFINVTKTGLARPTIYNGRMTQPALQYQGVKPRGTN